jgi:5'(3')-deoxyribonucleotidase
LLQISLDIDDVLAATMPRIIKIINRRTHRNFRLEDVTGWNLHNIFPLSEKDTQRLFGYIWSNRNWRTIKPTEPHIGGKVAKLCKLGRVNIVTSAGVDQVPGKMRWLDYHGIDQPLTVVAYGMTKEALGYDVYIDDRPETIEKVVDSGRIGILYDRPWNAACKVGIRVHNLQGAIEVVKRIRVEHKMRLEVKNSKALELALRAFEG